MHGEAIESEVAHFGMQPHDAVAYLRHSLGVVGVAMARSARYFEVQEESLNQCVVPAIALAADAANKPWFVGSAWSRCRCAHLSSKRSNIGPESSARLVA